MPEDATLNAFAAYALAHTITISPLITPHRFPDRGLGIRATAPVPPSTQLMRIPTSAILKWSDIPRDFMPCPPPPAAADEGGVRVHARLAAYLAFGRDFDQRYGAWMATWPEMGDFRLGMPALWSVGLGVDAPRRKGRLSSGLKKGKAERCERVREGEDFAVLPPGITGVWATLDDTSGRGVEGKLAPQQRKFEGDLVAAARFFPALKDRSSAEYERFLYCWCCVNTRCFYYWPTWKVRRNGKLRIPPPEPVDRDEAMAMCPGMDFFNHTPDEDGGLCCTVDYDENGFTVVSPSVEVQAGEELLISYGAHDEENLWAEYGFMLGDDRNKWDGINLDTVVLGDRRMSQRDRKRLRDAGYEGDYTMKRDGVCWRTETAARLLVMEPKLWDQLVEGTYYNDRDEEEETVVRKAAEEVMIGWIAKVQQEAENSLNGLQRLTDSEVLELFGDRNNQRRDNVAETRLDMCLSRWWQMLAICIDAIKAIGDS